MFLEIFLEKFSLNLVEKFLNRFKKDPGDYWWNFYKLEVFREVSGKFSSQILLVQFHGGILIELLDKFLHIFKESFRNCSRDISHTFSEFGFLWRIFLEFIPKFIFWNSVQQELFSDISKLLSQWFPELSDPLEIFPGVFSDFSDSEIFAHFLEKLR